PPVELAPLSPRPLERLGGDLLRRGPVAQQAGHVGIDVVTALPIEGFEGETRFVELAGCCGDGDRAHTRTTARTRFDHGHTTDIGSAKAVPWMRCLRRLRAARRPVGPLRPRPAR